MKKSGWKIILGVAVLVCVICLGRFGWVKYQDYKTEQARKATLKVTLNLTVKDIKQAYQRNFVTFSDMPVFISHQYSCFI